MRTREYEKRLTAKQPYGGKNADKIKIVPTIFTSFYDPVSVTSHNSLQLLLTTNLKE